MFFEDSFALARLQFIHHPGRVGIGKKNVVHAGGFEIEDAVLAAVFRIDMAGKADRNIEMARGIDTAIVTGCTTSGCVRATAVDAMGHGFRPIIPRECVGDRAEGPHEANLFDLQQKYADVMSLREVKEELAKLTPGQSDVAPDAPAE